MIVLDDAKLEERRRAVAPGGPLAPLFDSLASELEPLLGRELMIPTEKALLSRVGGRCEIDGSVLEFDPWSPHRHRCEKCGGVYTGELHDRAWVMPYQLWLAERAVHGAVFHALRGDERHASLARDILRAYADRYMRYPNQDNVLGPTRLFFSTYLESIWLLQIVIAADLLARAGDTSTAAVVRDRIVLPSSSLIAEYDEGMSNRQVWNNAALLAAAALLDDREAFDRRLGGASGVRAHLSRALLSDGTWYEGENYHQFALRGLWYCVTMCENRGCDFGQDLSDRFHRAFAAPYVTALPDFTMPSRKDSQYAVSLRQWRMAELAELGFARNPQPLLAGALRRTYETGHERRETGRARSTADVERNHPGSRLTRADLGWRSLLHALPTLPELPQIAPRSVLLEDQGYAVFRRENDVYVGFEFGQSGGGHGHPDRLNLTLYQGDTRWLDDMGTGSYVDPSLHWYRSTLAHNAPLVDGKSQPLRDGTLLAYDEREGLGWIVAEFCIPEKNVRLERTIVVAPDYLIDQLSWSADDDVVVDLPWHTDSFIEEPEELTSLDMTGNPEDGFVYLHDARSEEKQAPFCVQLARLDGDRRLVASLMADDDVQVARAFAPGQPPGTERVCHVMRSRARKGTFNAIVRWSKEPQLAAEVSRAQEGGDHVFSLTAQLERHEHRRDERGWHIVLFAGSARSGVDLSGFRAPPQTKTQPSVEKPPATRVHPHAHLSQWLSEISRAKRKSLKVYDLGEEHYRRSEQNWRDAGAPSATVALGAENQRVVIFAIVTAGDPHFAAADDQNPLDNEAADTMRAGVQLYVRMRKDSGAWMLVPEADADQVRVRQIPKWGTLDAPTARWRRNANGYEMSIEVPLPTANDRELPVDLDVIINETTRNRERRRGQLVLSGAHGEFVYLRGDRHDVDRLIPFLIVR